MAEILTIRSWRNMWNDYVVEGLKKGAKREEIRRNLIEAFRKEIFGQLTFRLKTTDLLKVPMTPESIDIVRNITTNEKSKWRALIRECKKYPQTRDLIREEDLTLEDDPETPKREDAVTMDYEDVEDPDEEYESPWDGDEKTAEWPELNEAEGE